MSEKIDTDVVVAGAGPAGSIAALTIARLGYSVALVGPDAAPDRRTTALMAPAIEWLAELSVFQRLRDETAPLKVMRIVDGTRRLIRSPTVTFHAAEIGEEAFGHNIPNSALNRALSEAVSETAAITRIRAPVADWIHDDDNVVARLDDGTRVEARLVVAADGRSSPARSAAGIRSFQRQLRQSALVLNLAHGRDHGYVSTEIHTEAGPCTQVPLPGRRSSLVWVMEPSRAEKLSELPDNELGRMIEERMDSMLGKIEPEPGRQVWNLASIAPAGLAAKRTALVGEAAHVFPPIGAQGLNLGIRDVLDLATVLAGPVADPGAGSLLAAYGARRIPDVLARQTAVNLLNATLLSNLLPAQIARSAGLGLLAAAGPLRGVFMREGMRPGSGLAGLLDGLREQVRRKNPARDQEQQHGHAAH